MIRIFIAYSSKDLVFKDEIRKRLRPMERAGKVDVWDNYHIEAGKDWDAEVREKLVQSDIILLLLSPDALASDYFYEVEAPIALQRHEAGAAIAVGVLLRPCDLKYTPFGDMTKYELLPKKGLPITDRHWRIFDEAYLTIFQEVDVLVEKIDRLRNPRNGYTLKDALFGPEIVFVEGGIFQMGSNNYESEMPIHSVTVPSFWIGKYPVTFEEYDAFCAETGKKADDFAWDYNWGRGRRPVIEIGWDDAQDYCKWLSEKTGKKYRLPSESEWEYAARGGNLSRGYLYAGSNNIAEVAWYQNNSKEQTQPVGSLKANELGLYDMSGNVLEMCEDIWHDNHEEAPNNGTPRIGNSIWIVVKGGYWDGYENSCEIASRSKKKQGRIGIYAHSFRVARGL